MKLKRLLIFFPVIALVLAFFMYSVYEEVRESTIEESKTQQLLLAKQAARGIEGFFKHYEREFTFLANIEDLVVLNNNGKLLLKTYYLQNATTIKAITRVNEKGIITHTIPYNAEAIGTDISSQEHVRLLLKDQKPVISDVFKAVQGYMAIAYHIPVVRNGKFTGSIAILIPFKHIAKDYLENIRNVKNGYAWVLSRRGVEIYCPVDHHVGKSIFETAAGYPAVLSVAEKMMTGESGSVVYWYDKSRQNVAEASKKIAVYHPVRLGNTHWSINVVAPEAEVLKTMQGFTVRWMIIFILLMVVTFIYMYTTVRARTVIKESRKRALAEQELKKGEEKYRMILENIEEGYFEANLKGAITFANKTILGFLDWTEEELTEKHYRLLADDKNTRLLRDSFHQVYVTRAPIDLVEIEIFRKDGEKRQIEFSISPKRDHDGEIIGFLGMTRDITEKKRTQELVIQTEKMMSVGGLAAGMAHEINNPIGGIMQGAQNILRRLSPELTANLDTAEKYKIDLTQLQLYLKDRKILQTIDEIRNAGDRAAKIVTNILRFSRPSELDKTETDLCNLLDEAILLANNDFDLVGTYDFQQIKIIKEYQADTLMVSCNETELKQVFLNLLKNASQAMKEQEEPPQQPHIILRTEKVGDHVKIEVEDNGPGMEAEVQKRVFEPFFSTKPVGSGTGLGLSVSYMIVTSNHGGSMEVTSEPGKGTKFTICIPA